MKGSKTIPESLSAAPAALVTVAESLPLRRGAEERRGPTMPATMVVAEREVEEEVEVERLMFFFFFVERDPCESLILSKMLQSPPRASQAGSRGWRREEQLKPREQSRRDGSEQMSPSVQDVAASPTQEKKKTFAKRIIERKALVSLQGVKCTWHGSPTAERAERRSESRCEEKQRARRARREEARAFFFLGRKFRSMRRTKRRIGPSDSLPLRNPSLPSLWRAKAYLAASAEGARRVESISAKERLTKRFKRRR